MQARRLVCALACWVCVLLVSLAPPALAVRDSVVRPQDTVSKTPSRAQPVVARPVPARTPLPSRSGAFTSSIVRTALRFIGRPYQWAGIGNRGFDCSGLVLRVFAALGLALPHSSFDQYRRGISVPAAALSPGDLVFFRTYSAGPSHVGIYVGADRFIHASYSRGVVISSMGDPYYRGRYLGARRP